jgi:hypothetical protein
VHGLPFAASLFTSALAARLKHRRANGRPITGTEVAAGL